MQVLSIELPDDIYQNALSLPLDERQRRVASVFSTAVNVLEDDEENVSLTDEDRAALTESMADEEAGRVLDGATVFAKIRNERGWTK